jgi:hypothetical protein
MIQNSSLRFIWSHGTDRGVAPIDALTHQTGHSLVKRTKHFKIDTLFEQLCSCQRIMIEIDEENGIL